MHITKKNNLEQTILDKIEGPIRELGYGVCDVELSSGGGVLRVFIESSEGILNKVGIKECEEVHRVLGPMFDVWNFIDQAYTLEISSPGEKPHLRTVKHFQDTVGEELIFQTLMSYPMPAPGKPRKKWKAKLTSVDAEQAVIQVEDDYGSHQVKIKDICTAKWNRDWK